MDLIGCAKNALIVFRELVNSALSQVTASLKKSLLGLSNHLFGDGKVLHHTHGCIEHLTLTHKSTFYIFYEISLSRFKVFLSFLHLLPRRKDFVHNFDS